MLSAYSQSLFVFSEFAMALRSLSSLVTISAKAKINRFGGIRFPHVRGFDSLSFKHTVMNVSVGAILQISSGVTGDRGVMSAPIGTYFSIFLKLVKINSLQLMPIR